MSVKEDLIAAREHLAKVGLHKGSLYKDNDSDDVANTPCCTNGAIGFVTGDSFLLTARYEAARLAVQGVVRSEGWSFSSSFNDAPETTLADVLAVFDKAIEAQP